MKKMYWIFSACVFALFCLLEIRGVSWDSNHAVPDPKIYTSRSSGGGYSSGGYYSSK